MHIAKTTAVVFIVVILVAAGAAAALLFTADDKNKDQGTDTLEPITLSEGDLSIHFLELGNGSTGDCIYIKYGDMDILIDAGSVGSSARTITNYLNAYVDDGKLEFVIATHADMDHIAAFVGTNAITGVLDSFEIGTIIDYPRSDKTTAVRNNYEAARDRLVISGAEHYTALECYKNENGAQRVYDLGPGVTMEILYNYYYENKSSDENDYSVCLMIVQDGKQYLFTGDLESDGESKLVDYYEANYGGLGHCVFFKGGHHGSATSSTDKLLNAITPDYVVVCAVAGSAQYTNTVANQFPTQAFVDRIAPHTTEVYVTSYINNGSAKPFNGNIVFLVSTDEDGDVDISMICSADDKVLMDTDWFITSRTMPPEWRRVHE
jgi:beta-lactamase superfamily II metal-dependent hydrolase